MYSHMNPKSLPQGGRKDKLMDRGREGVFLGYVDGTTKQYIMWAPDMKKAIRVSTVRFSEHEKGGDLELGIKISSSSNAAPMRNEVGRPRQETEPVITRRVLSRVQIPTIRRESPEQVVQERDQRGSAESVEKETQAPKVRDQEDNTSQEPVVDDRNLKRLREDDDDDDNEEPLSKHLRAFLGLEDYVEEALAAHEINREEVPIPNNYYEAINDPV